MVNRSEGHVGLACIVRVERSVGSFQSYLSSHSLYSVNDSHTNPPTTHLPVSESLPLQVRKQEFLQLWVKGGRGTGKKDWFDLSNMEIRTVFKI